MDKLKKYKLIDYILRGLLILVVIIDFLLLKLLDKDTVAIIFIVVGCLAIFPFMIYFESNIKKLEAEKKNQDDKIKEEEFCNELVLKRDYNIGFEAMYIIYNNQALEINELIKDLPLKITYDYSKDDMIYEVTIESEEFNRKRFYFSSVCVEKDKCYLALSEQKKEIDIINQSVDEIIKMISNDIIEYKNNHNL